MKYRTDIEAQKLYEELYVCRDCGHQHESYSHLYHPNDETGGFCAACKSETVDVMVYKTVYSEVWVLETDDPIEVAMQVDMWEVADHAIRMKGEQKNG